MFNIFFIIFLLFQIIFASNKNHRIDEESIKTQFAPSFEVFPLDADLTENIYNKNKRKIREVSNSNNKEGGGVGIYWMSPEGPDFQTWSIPTSSYGSQQQINKNNNKQLVNEKLISGTSISSPSGPSISFHQQPQVC
uniref:Uncharacterized protein n=1 Tax=Meloidogyne hapla TaxID=6305 RepID=A0A1I8BY91_MELHA